MNISTGIMRAICMPALLALFAPAAGAKDYSTTLADNVDVVYAVNTSDLIARVKRVQNYNKSMVAKVEVPKTIKYKSGGKTYTLTVTKIGDGAFDDVENIKTLVLPNTITYIGNDAFNFSDIPNINIPKQLETIGDRAFYASSIKSAAIPGTCKKIGAAAFDGSELTTLTFEESPTPLTIGEKAFDFVPLTNVTLPARLSSLGNGAFNNCRQLLSVTIMNAPAIPDDCFNYCICLSSVSLPASVTSIGARAFQDCRSLASFPFLPNLKTIGANAFDACAFRGINLQQGLLTIGAGAFMDNENLFTVSLPASLQSIGQNCFTGCNSLERIECMAVTPPAMAMPCFSVDCSKVPAYVPQASVNAYKTAQGWKLFDYGHYDHSAVDSITTDTPAHDVQWYTLSGLRLSSKPTHPGIYIRVTDNTAARVAIK